MAGTGTTHHRRVGWSGLLMIITLPFVLWFATCAIPHGATGFVEVLSNPTKAIITLIFFTGAFWYCKLEFDHVVMDYWDNGMRKFGLVANTIIAFLSWAAAAYAVLKFAFLG